MKGGMRHRSSPAGAGEKPVGLEMEQSWLLTGNKHDSLQAVLNSCMKCSVMSGPSSCLHCYATNNNQSSGRAAVFLGKHLDVPHCVWKASSNFSG